MAKYELNTMQPSEFHGVACNSHQRCCYIIISIWIALQVYCGLCTTIFEIQIELKPLRIKQILLKSETFACKDGENFDHNLKITFSRDHNLKWR